MARITQREAFLGTPTKGPVKQIDNNTWRYVHEDGTYRVRHQKTDVVIVNPLYTTLNTGGWKSATTKDRINKYSAYHVHQFKNKWFVTTDAGEFPFDGDEIIIDRRTGEPV